MENNENNVQNQEKKQSKGISAPLVVIMLIAVLIIGIGGGYLLSKNNQLFNKNENQTNNTNSNNTNDNNKNENKVISVVSVEDSSEMVKRQMTIEGRDKDNNRVWSYTTLAENIPQEAINRGLKLIETRKGKVYLCDWGKLYILDEQTGKVLAQNTEHNIGAAAVYIFDENDNLYTTSYLAAVDKFDTNAKLLKTTDSKIWDKGFYWPKKMTLNGNNLIIDYGDEGSVTVNKETLEIIDAKNNTNMQQNQTTSTSNTTNTTTNVSEGYAKYYIEKIKSLDYTNDSTKYGLLDISGSNIPYLVVDTGGDLSIYKINNNTVLTLKERSSYGTHGRDGYDYIEGTRVMRDYCTFSEGYGYEVYDNDLSSYKYYVGCTFDGKYTYSESGEEKTITEEEFNKLSYKNSKYKHLRDVANKSKEEIINVLENK